MERGRMTDYSVEPVKLNYDQINIEVTRRCNLTCRHCVRGEAQNIDISEEIIDKLFDQINDCSIIMLLGGEPLLVPEKITYIINKIMDEKIHIKHFSFITNGTLLNNETIKVLEALNDLNEYCCQLYYHLFGENTLSYIGIGISKDVYHDNDPQRAVDFFKKYLNKNIIVHTHPDFNLTEEDIIREGRAEDNDIGEKYRFKKCPTTNHRIMITDDGCVKCNIAIGAKGNVYFNDMQSFDNIDNNSIGSILYEPLSCILYKWQWKEPLTCAEVYNIDDVYNLIKNNKLNENDEKILKKHIDYLLLKRDLLKKRHEEYPLLSYDEVVDLVDSQINLHTNGEYGSIAKQLEYTDKFPKDWTYSPIKELFTVYRLTEKSV